MKERAGAPAVSILVTAYNTESYLPRCLDSIRAQTLDDWECVCVDNGSTDGSGKVMDEYAKKDSRFVVVHKEYGEQGAGRNAALDAARGEYVGFVDSDDWIETETYDLALAAAKRTGADIVQWSGVDETANGPVQPKMPPEGFFDPVSGYEEYFSYHVTDKLFSRAFIKNSGERFYEGVIQGDDAAFSAATYPLAEKCFFLARALYHYDVTRESSVTNNKTMERLLGECIGIKAALESAAAKRPGCLDGGGYEFFLKLNSKRLFIGRDYRLFRSTFPEINGKIFPHFLRARDKKAFTSLLAAWRMGWLIDAIVWLRAQFRRFASR